MTSAAPEEPIERTERVDAPEVSVRTTTPLLLFFERQYGSAALQELWAKYQLPVTLEYLKTPTNYVSLSFLEYLSNVLTEESHDPGFMRKAGLSIASRDALGFAYYVLKAFGSPKVCYEKTLQFSSTYNSVGSFSIVNSSATSMQLKYHSRQPEKNRNICELRMGQFASFPLIWGLPFAEVTELECQVAGAEACQYHLRWHNPVQAWRRFAGGLAGLTTATPLLVTHAPAAPVLGAATVILGWMAGSWLDLRVKLREKEEQLASQNEGLIVSLQDLQRRHEEVFRANTELERRVEVRTAELTEANRKLGEALERQRELDRQKTEFFDNVSHELRTPLTIILLSLESLLMRDSGQVPAPVREHLQAMDRSASRLVRLINNLLDLAKMEAGKRRLQYQPVEMQSFLRSMLVPFKVVADEKKLVLDLKGSSTTPVHVDAEMMDVVFQNLVSNALKFTSKGGVSIQLNETESDVLVEVQDTGLGMTALDLNVIFDRFAQADSSGLRRFGGTGIGLALVKETVELHGGKITVTSEQNQGSVFKVAIPKGEAHIREDLRERRQADLPVRRERRLTSVDPIASLRSYNSLPQLQAPNEEQESLERDFNSAAKKILVVDDDHEIRRYITQILKEDFIVWEAVNGEEGLKKVIKLHPDLIVSDVMMPVMSGLQFMQALRSRADTADIPVVLLTARHEIESRLVGLSAGANDYISKPFSPRELLARVETQLRIREASIRAAENERLTTMGLLSSGFAHEVRNPLNGLLNALEPLREQVQLGSDPDASITFIRIIRECGERVRELAESLLSFAQPSDHEEFIDVPSSLESTIKVLGWKMPEGVRIKRVYDCTERARGDPAALNMVWLNLIDNALKAMGDQGELTITTQRANDEMIISVSDTGPGVPEEIRERLFEPFFSTRRPGEGTGLGLALCRKVILRHGGRIEVESQVGQGTTFRVALPLLDRVRQDDMITVGALHN